MNTFDKITSTSANETEILKMVREAISDIRTSVEEDRSGVWSARSVLDALTASLDAYVDKSSSDRRL